MSAAGRNLVSGGRHPDDFYRTPAWAVRAILPALQCPTERRVLDPCCGDGAILDVLKTAKMMPRTYGIELDRDRAERARGRGHIVATGNALQRSTWFTCDLLVTNPPYSLATEFIERAFSEFGHSTIDLAFLLRLNFLGSQARANFHRLYPSDVLVLPQRPEFVASLSCKGKCGWAVVQELEALRPSRCPVCEAGVNVTTTDACEYAWFVWGPGRGNRWQMLSSAKV